MHWALRFSAILLFALPQVAQAHSDRDQFLDIARKGWIYELRTSMWRPDPTRPPIVLNGRDMAGAALCIVGETPHPRTRSILKAFGSLVAEVFEKPMPMRFAGADLADCGTGRLVFLRLYSGAGPHRAFNQDLLRIDDVFDVGLPRDRDQYILSPAQAQTFFGRNGRATHLLVKQPQNAEISDLEQQFFASILIEELFQSFTYGVDILHFDRQVAFVSKLEETPVNLRNLPWESTMFMEGILATNPARLCRFDVFMLHALAKAPVDRTNSEAFIRYIEAQFDELIIQTEDTIVRSDYAQIVDRHCSTRN